MNDFLVTEVFKNSPAHISASSNPLKYSGPPLTPYYEFQRDAYDILMKRPVLGSLGREAEKDFISLRLPEEEYCLRGVLDVVD